MSTVVTSSASRLGLVDRVLQKMLLFPSSMELKCNGKLNKVVRMCSIGLVKCLCLQLDATEKKKKDFH